MKKSHPIDFQFPQVQALPENKLGRDFIMGDLHGCLELLQRILEFVRFDAACDRLFSVGDLMDRGPDSWGAMQLVRQPWFYGVLGNHERLLIECFSDYVESGNPICWDNVVNSLLWFNGGNWVRTCYEPERQRMQPEFDELLGVIRQMPVLWIVGNGDARFHVIHAELARREFRSGRKAIKPVWLDEDIDRWLASGRVPGKTLHRLAWGRTLMSSRRAMRGEQPVQEGLSPTYCGHTFDTRVRRFLSHVCLDTGAYCSLGMNPWDVGVFALTVCCVQERRYIRASYGYRSVLIEDHGEQAH